MTLFNPSQPQKVQEIKFPSGSSIANFVLGPTPTIILQDRSAANSRRGLCVFHSGTANNALFAYGTNISLTTFSAEILPGGYIEDSPSAPWQGAAVMRSVSGNATVNVTEITLI